MSTAYTFDATIARAPVRRPLSSLTPKAAEASQRFIKAFARIFAMSAAVVSVVAALLLIHIGNPAANASTCTLSASLHNALARPDVSPLADERDWLTHGLPVLEEPTGTAVTAGDSCFLP
jgi:hypothetical protein